MHRPRKILTGLTLAASASGAVAPPAQAATDPRFGVMTHYAHGWDPRSIPLVAQGGIAGVRDEVYWRQVEPEKGVFRFPEYFDRYMGELARHGVSPLIVLSFENDHYDNNDTPHTDEGIAAFARYGAEVVRRYSDQIQAVEVWNEYNGSFIRGPASQDRVANYLRLLRATHAEVKRSRPDVTVVGGVTAGVPLPYWERLLAGGALEHMDALSVHPYRYDAPPEGIETDIAELAALVKRYSPLGGSKPIWVTEIGWNTRAAKAPGDLAIDEAVQAQFLVRAYALLFSAGVERVYWYLLRDYEEVTMGLLRGDEQPKPAYAALATMIRQLEGAAFVARERTVSTLYSILFRRGDGEDVRVMWSLEPRTLTIPETTRVTTLDGEARAPEASLALGAAPVFVVGAVEDLPGATEVTLADSRREFSVRQGEAGWSYGYMVGAEFVPLPAVETNDWRAAWAGPAPYLSVAASEQHPSAMGEVPVAAVRRWRSDRNGEVRVTGVFRGGKYGGDGVGVGIAVDGQPRLERILGGGEGRPVAETFDFTVHVKPGSLVDFVVNPGPSANFDYDGVAVSAVISKATQ